MRILPKLTVPTGMLLLIIGVASSTVIAQQRPDLEGICLLYTSPSPRDRG